MPHYLLIGAGFSRNWDGPLSEEITGSLLGELNDDTELAAALRQGPLAAMVATTLPSSTTSTMFFPAITRCGAILKSIMVAVSVAKTT